MLYMYGGNKLIGFSTQMYNVFCRANGRCPCQRFVPRERRKCLKSSKLERDKRKPGKEWSPKLPSSVTASPVNLQSMSVSSDPW